MEHLAADVVALLVEQVQRVDHHRLPQLAAVVVVLGDGDVPAVFLDVEAPLAVDVAEALAQRGLDHPDAPQLVSHVVRVGVPGRQQLILRQRGVVETVAVERHVHFLSPDQRPLEAVHGAVESQRVVDREEAAGAVGRVIADVRRLADAPRSGQVAPDAARRLGVVERFVDQRDRALVAHRFLDREPDVGGILAERLEVGADGDVGVGEQDLHVRHAAAQRTVAVGVDDHIVGEPLHVVGWRAESRVPDRVGAHRGYRKRQAAGIAVDTVIAVVQFRVGGVVARPLRRVLGHAEIAVRGVDVHAEGLGIGLEQRLLSRAEARAVLLNVLRRDREQRFLARVGVGIDGGGAGKLEPRRHTDDLAAPRGDRSVGVAGHLRAGGRELRAEPGRLLLAHLGRGQRRRQRQGQSAYQKCTHARLPRCACQKLYLMLNATLSRSMIQWSKPPPE